MKKSFAASFIKAVTSGMTTMLSVGAFVSFFGVLITVLTKSGILLTISNAITKIFGPFLADNGLLQGLITGFFEMTNGIMNLQSGDFYGSVTVAALLLGWAGMSVHFQTMTFISKAGLSSKNYFLGKLCQGFISMSLMWLYFRFVPISREIFYYEYPYWYGYELGFSNRFWMANLICTAVFALFTLLAYFSIEFFTEKRYNKKRKRKGEDKCFTEKE